MANIGTATVNITPVIDEDALSQVDTAIREAVADALSKVAASLVAKPTAAAPEGPRFQYAQIAGREGILDTQRPGLWEDYGQIADDPDRAMRDERFVREEAAELNKELTQPGWDETGVAGWQRVPTE